MPVPGGRGSPPCPGAAPQPRARPAGGRLLSRLPRRNQSRGAVSGITGAPRSSARPEAEGGGREGRPDLSRGAKPLPLLRAPPGGHGAAEGQSPERGRLPQQRGCSPQRPVPRGEGGGGRSWTRLAPRLPCVERPGLARDGERAAGGFPSPGQAFPACRT